jgi:hypothetical protein
LVSDGEQPADGAADQRPIKICPDCAETVLAAARRCRFCGYRFDSGARERRSPLEELTGGLIRRDRPGDLHEILAGWDYALAAGDNVRFFRPAGWEGRSGYLLVTDGELVFFGAAGRRQHAVGFSRPLSSLTGVETTGRLGRRQLVLGFASEEIVLRDDGERGELAQLVEYLRAFAG